VSFITSHKVGDVIGIGTVEGTIRNIQHNRVVIRWMADRDALTISRPKSNRPAPTRSRRSSEGVSPESSDE